MSQPETQQTQQLRRTVRKTIERHDTITVAEVVTAVSSETGSPEPDVLETMDELERNGFLYLVGSECPPGEKEVRLP